MKTERPSELEMELIKEFILLPFVLTVLERDKKLIVDAGVKYPIVYEEVIDSAMERIFKRLGEIRSIFYKNGIKVFEKSRSNIYLINGYLCRGYENEFTLNWDHVKAEVELLVRKHLMQV